MKNPLEPEVYLLRTRPKEEDVRGAFFRDQTAIIHSMPFRRLKHKTQVFYAPENDHVCTRIEHVMHVATIAKSICKGLNNLGWELNVEMAFAIGLGHDLGHAPFGHDGESIINKLLGGNNAFLHEVNSYLVVEHLCNDGKGLNLTYGVKDGIICHNGEKFEQILKPQAITNDLEKISNRNVIPSSYEACIVRFSDKIAYLGRDIEDAIIAGFITENDIPQDIKNKTGSTNRDFINTFVNDVIDFSKDKDVIGFSDEKFELIKNIRDFNYEKIYYSDKRTTVRYVDIIITTIFEYLFDLYQKNGNNYQAYEKGKLKLDKAFGKYLSEMEHYYKNCTEKKIPVKDYVAGMTDLYAIDCMKQITLPQPVI